MHSIFRLSGHQSVEILDTSLQLNGAWSSVCVPRRRLRSALRADQVSGLFAERPQDPNRCTESTLTILIMLYIQPLSAWIFWF